MKIDSSKNIEDKLSRTSKRNTLKTVNICFWGYLALSIIFLSVEFLGTMDWDQIVMPYSLLDIIIGYVYSIVRWNLK